MSFLFFLYYHDCIQTYCPNESSSSLDREEFVAGAFPWGSQGSGSSRNIQGEGGEAHLPVLPCVLPPTFIASTLLCRRDVCWLFLLLLPVDRTISNHFKEKQSQLSNFSTSESEPFLSSSPNPSASADRTSPTAQCQGSCAIDLHNGILLSCSLCTLMFHPRF